MKNDSNLLIYMPLGKAPASRSQLFCRGTCESESAIFPGMWDLRVRVSYFGCQKATYESESAIFQGHLRVRVSYFSGPRRGQRCRLRSIQLKLACLAACGGESMLLRKCRHVWHRFSPGDGLTMSLRVRVRCFPSRATATPTGIADIAGQQLTEFRHTPVGLLDLLDKFECRIQGIFHVYNAVARAALYLCSR